MIAGDIEICLLGIGDEPVLDSVADRVFDRAINRTFARVPARAAFHLAVAVDAGVMIGMASAVDYIYPVKPRELCINRVGVARSHSRNRETTAARVVRARPWPALPTGMALTRRSNAAAMLLYASLGGTAKARDTLFQFGFRGDAGAVEPSAE